jgi:Nucleotidyl transferase AbiEii toxin, Type IV TA system
MQIERGQQMAPTAEIRLANGVQNGVQNDRIRLGLRGSGTFGLPAKFMFLTPGKGLELSDSDIASTKFPAVSREEQFAEKLHACTLPRVGRENSRVKDLVDLVLLIERTRLDLARLPKAIHETFQRRKTHDIPPALPLPPPS